MPGQATALHLDAVSDYVPALDEGLALDYGPEPDNEAARDYGRAIDYDALPAVATAQNATTGPNGATAQTTTGPASATAQDATRGPDEATAEDGVTAPDDAAPRYGEPPGPRLGPDHDAATVVVPATAGARPAPARAAARLRLATAAEPGSATATAGPASAVATAEPGSATATAEPASAVATAGHALATATARPTSVTDTGAAPDPLSAPATAPPSGTAQAVVSGPPAAAGLVAAPAADSVADPGVPGSPDAQPCAAGYDAGWVSPATYWRRRVVALIVGIALLTVLAWAVSGVLHGSGAGQARSHGKHSPAQSGGARRPGRSDHSGRTRGHAARGNGPQSLPAPRRAMTGPAHAGRQGPSRVLASRVRTTGGRSRHASLGTLSGISDVLTAAGYGRQATAAAGRAAPPLSVGRAPRQQTGPRARNPRATAPRIPPCARGDVVLSLVSPRYWYERGRWPLFGVDAVSTGDRPCRFDMGGRSATVVVTSGRNRIWGSADCVPGTGSQPVVLRRGVPAVRWIYWDRATSIPGCRRPGRQVRQGAYTAIAFDGQLSSQALVILLGRPGTFLP